MKKSAKPFFAKFLEHQVKNSEVSHIKGSGGGSIGLKPPYDVTMKYPSDGDDDLLADRNVTLKYPSDGDEGGV